MATIINNPGPNDVQSGSSSSMGWIIAILIIVILVLLGIFFLPRFLSGTGSSNPYGTNGGAPAYTPPTATGGTAGTGATVVSSTTVGNTTVVSTTTTH
jgi:hypothetical protein